MKLYVMRHGPAEEDAPSGRDFDRALTASGRDRVRSVARALVAGGEAPFVVLSSPLVRALETAEIVAAVTKLDARVREEPEAAASGATGVVDVRRELAPGGNSHGLVLALARAGRKRVMLVGHEPDLSGLVTRLVGRAPPQGMLKAMVVGVKLSAIAEPTAGAGVTSSLRFVLDPKTLAWDRG